MIDFVTNYKFVMFNKSSVFVNGSYTNIYASIVPVYSGGQIDPDPLFSYAFYGQDQSESFVNSTDVPNNILLGLIEKILSNTNTFKDVNKYIRDNNISNDFILSQYALDRNITYSSSSSEQERVARIIFSPYSIYEAPVDNSEVFQLLNGISQVWSTSLSDDDYKKVRAIEAYNSNFIKWYSLFNSSEVSSSSSSDVDLSTINTQLTNIANNLKTTVHDDNTGEDVEVSVTDIIKDKEDTNLIEIQEVETKNKELVPFLNNDEWSF